MSKKENTTPMVETEGVEEPVKQPTKAQRIISAIVNVVLVVAIVLAVLATYVSFSTTSGNVPAVLGMRLYSVQTKSMEPTLMKGDLVISTAVKDPKTLKHDDIITYWTIIDGERVLNTHRIVEISNINGSLGFTTKGDNNTTNDSQYVHQRDVVGKYSFRLAGVGKVFDYLQTSKGFLLVVVIPVLIFLLYQLIQFFRVLFEYQNVKNRIKFEMERGRTEDLIAEKEADQAAERERIEAELREKLRAELLAEQAAATAAEPVAEEPVEAPVEEPVEAEGDENNA
jgi:signal peptidase